MRLGMPLRANNDTPPVRASRAVGYARVSSEHGQHSIEDQLNMIGHYADVQDIEVVEFYAERNSSNAGEKKD